MLHLQDVKKMQTNWKIMDESGSDLNLKRYRRFLQEKGYRESTVESYSSNIARYLKFVGKDKPTLIVGILEMNLRRIAHISQNLFTFHRRYCNDENHFVIVLCI